MVVSSSLNIVPIYFVLTSVMVNTGYSLRCPECIVSKWTVNQTCNVTVCPSSTHRCLSLDAQLFEKKGRDERNTSYLHNKTCIKNKDCDEKILCQRFKNDMWKKQEDIFVSECKAKCSSPETSTPVVGPTTRSYNMGLTNYPATTAQIPSQKCLACARESLSTLCNGKPQRIRCGSVGFNSCFTLKAELINATSGAFVKEGHWQDCAVAHRDCGARGKCTQLRKWLRSRGYDWKVCNAECCRGDYCNSFIPTPPVVPDAGAGSGAGALHFNKASILLTGLVIAVLLFK